MSAKKSQRRAQMKGTEEEIGAYAGLPGLFSRVKIFKAFRIYHGNPLIIMAGQRNL